MRGLAAWVSLWLLGCGGIIDTTSSSGGAPATGPGDRLRRAPDAAVAASPDGGADTASGDTVVTVSTPLDPNDDGSKGVKDNGSGGIVLDPIGFLSDAPPIIWIANSDEGTVSKVDIRSMKELARYRTGPGSFPDPSRTTVSLLGDVVVANRAGSTATRIAGDLARCVDQNGDGQIQTSGGGDDVLDWGEDECVLWHVVFPQGTLARAATFGNDPDPDGGDSRTVWIGLYYAKVMKQLDGATGKELATINVAPVRPYGAAVDRSGNVWVRGDGIVRIDPSHNVTHVEEPPCGYGLSVDNAGRVFIGGAKCIARYTPQTGKWDIGTVGQSFNRGMAIDGQGRAWLADTSYGVHQVDLDTLKVVRDLPLGLSNIVGMAVDFDGRIWAISQGSSMAVRIDPDDYSVAQIKTGKGPYTYSDMTGYQLRRVTLPTGTWRHVFPACADDARFEKLSWKAALPPGTALVVKARWGANAGALAQAPWTRLAMTPPDSTTVDLGSRFGAAATGALFEVEVRFDTVNPEMSPMLDSMSLTMACEPIIG